MAGSILAPTLAPSLRNWPPPINASTIAISRRDTRYMQIFRGHLMWVLPEEAHLITVDLIRSITLTGTVEELREKIRTLAAAGYRQLTIQLVPGHEDALNDWARVIEGL